MVSALLAQAAHWRLSDTSRNCSIAVPTPSVTGHQLHGWRQWEREGQGGGDGGRLLGPQAEAGGYGAVGPMRCGGCSAWGQVGGGASGESPHRQRTRREAVSAPGEEAPSWGHVHMASKDKDNGHVPALLGVERQGAPGMRGDTRPRERFHLATLLPPCRTSLPSSASRPRCLLPASHPGTQSEMAGSLGVEMSTNSHTGHGSGHWYTGQKKDPRLSFKQPGPAWGCSPRQMNGRKRP